MCKVLLVYGSGKLFRLGDVWKTHLFNWTRFTLLTVGVTLLGVLLYYFGLGLKPGVYQAAFIGLIVLLALSVLILFSKVARRVEHSWFHIFSYLCATEIIPLLISIKVTYQ
jgi:hypothetical protein